MSGFSSSFAETIFNQKYAHEKEDGIKEHWSETAQRVSKNVLKSVGAKKSLIKECENLITLKKFIPGGRYLYASGRPFHQVQNCLLLRAKDSREGWAELLHNASLALMTGAGIGIDYSDIRGEGRLIRKTGGIATGPIALMQMINDCGHGIIQGGARRSAIWAGLNWNHPDIMKFILAKNWSEDIMMLKSKNFNFPAFLDMTNISVQLDDLFFEAYHNEKHILYSHAQSVYWAVIENMLKTGEPGFSVDTGKNIGETLRNACGEVASKDDSDICNLGSINMARIESEEDMKNVVEVATAFLLAGSVYSDVPYAKVDQMRTKNRRLGLGLMGLHEWLLKKNKKYGPDEELEKYLKIYSTNLDYAHAYAKEWDLSKSVKGRAIAPNGTIGIIAETTTGIEPIFCVAYKRRYLKGQVWNYQYVIDPTAKKLIDLGISPNFIEDAYSLSYDITKRAEFQVWVQQYVDHAISSTINLPQWGSESNNDNSIRKIGNILIENLPKLRGITCFPDGGRGLGAQPLNVVSYQTAIKHEGEVFVENGMDVCSLSKGGICGD